MGLTRALLFDFGGTLDWPEHWLDRFLRHYRAAGLEPSRKELDLAYDDATRRAYRNGEPLKRLGLRDLVRYLVGVQLDYLCEHGPEPLRDALALANRASGLDELAVAISARFAAESSIGLENSREVMSSLSSRFKLGVVSNFYGNLDCVLAEAGMAEMVKVVIDSGRIKIYKPDARIFEAALRGLGLPADAVVMVGDSLGKDCIPARRLGMRTVWLRTGVQGDGDAVADFIIGKLEDLKRLAW
ncbi:MAG: HAD family hydrolase, partial [Candidatus Binataceae bacterium]